MKSLCSVPDFLDRTYWTRMQQDDEKISDTDPVWDKYRIRSRATKRITFLRLPFEAQEHHGPYTLCPGSSEPFYIASPLYKMGHYFLDIPDPDNVAYFTG